MNKETLEKAIIALMVAAITFLFVQAVKVDPVVTAVVDLKLVMVENNKQNEKRYVAHTKQQDIDRRDNANQHAELSMMVYSHKEESAGTKMKLFRVIEDCKENHQEIQKCRADWLKLNIKD